MTDEERRDMEVLPVTDKRVDDTPPFCSRHKGERLQRAWRLRGWRLWHFYWCRMCDE